MLQCSFWTYWSYRTIIVLIVIVCSLHHCTVMEESICPLPHFPKINEIIKKKKNQFLLLVCLFDANSLGRGKYAKEIKIRKLTNIFHSTVTLVF